MRSLSASAKTCIIFAICNMTLFSATPPITGGNPAARASFRLVPTYAQGVGLYALAPKFFANLAANPTSPPIPFPVPITGLAKSVPLSRSKPQSNATINIVGRPSQVGTVTNQSWQLDINGSENPAGQPPGSTFSFGPSGSAPLVGDWSGTGFSYVGSYLNGVFYLDSNGDGTFTPGTDAQIALGVSGIPVIGDWNGNGKTKVGIYDTTNGYWTLDYDGTGQNPRVYTNFAAAADPQRHPVVGDWNGDGRSKIGWNVNGFWSVDYNGNGVWDGETIDRFAGFGGNAGETPFVGDWTGSGTGKIGVYSQGFWAEDTNGNFAWDEHQLMGLAVLAAIRASFPL